MTKQKKVVSVLSTSAISGLVASALMTSQAFAAVDAYTVKVGGDVYQYSKTELMESYLDSTEGTKAPLFEDFQAKLTEAKSVYAYHDDKNGYVTAQSVFDKYLENEKGFNLDEFTESKEAKVVEVPTVKKAVVKDGEIKYEDQNNNTGEDDKVKVTSVSAINLKQLKIEFASPVTDSDLKKDIEDVDNYTLEDKDGDEVDSDMIKEIKLDDNKKSATLTFADKVDSKGKYLIENREKYSLVIDEDVTGEEYRKELVFEDKDLPEVEKVEAVGVDTIKVTFSEPIRPNNIDKISDDSTIAPILDDDDFEINDGDLSISRVELVNNNKEANIIVGTDFKDGDKLKVRVKSSVTDYAGLATMSPNKETTVKEDKKIPQVVGFKDVDTEDINSVTYEKVTLIFDKDIKFKNMDNSKIDNAKDLENYYHTSDKTSNRAKLVKVDGKELTLYFEDDSFTNGTTNIYIKSGAIESRWEVENEKISTRIEKEVDNTAPEVRKVEQHEDYNNKIKIKFSEKVKCSKDTDDGSATKKKNYTLKDSDGKEWKIDKVERDGTSEKEFIITTIKDLDADLKYKLTVENIEDKAGNAIKKVTKDLDVKDNDGVAEGDIKVKVYSAGSSSQKVVVDFDNKMLMDGSRYSAKDLSKYTLVAKQKVVTGKDKDGNDIITEVLADVFDGKSSINMSDMYKADIKSAKNDKAVEITLPSKKEKNELKDKQYHLGDLSTDKINNDDVVLYLQVDRVEDANKNVTERNYSIKINKTDFLGKGEEGSIAFDDDDDFKPQIQSPEDIFFGFEDKVDFDVKDMRVITAPDLDTAQKAADSFAGVKDDKDAESKVTQLSIASHKKGTNDGNTTVKLTMDKKHANAKYDDDDFDHIFNYNGTFSGNGQKVYIFAVPNKTVGNTPVTSTKNDYDETLQIGAKGLVYVEDKLAPAIVDNNILIDTAKQGLKDGKRATNDDELVQYWQKGTNAAIVLTFEEEIDGTTLSRSTFELNDDDFCDAKIDSIKAYNNKVVIMLSEVKDGNDSVNIGDGFEILQKAPFEDIHENKAEDMKLQVGDFDKLTGTEMTNILGSDATEDMKNEEKDESNQKIADAKKAITALSLTWDTDLNTTITKANEAITKAKEENKLAKDVTAVAEAGIDANAGNAVIKITYGTQEDKSIVIAAPVTAAPILANGVSFADAIGSGKDGNTVITLGAPSVAGNTFVYKISDDANAVPTPNVGDDLSTWTAVANGAEITAANGKHIGVAEVDASKKAVQFSDATAVTVDYTVATKAVKTADADLKSNVAFDTATKIVLNGEDVALTKVKALGTAYDAKAKKDTLAATLLEDINAVPSLSGKFTVTLNGDKLVISSVDTGATEKVDLTGSDVTTGATLLGFTTLDAVNGTNAAN
ncbi:Ig-like domain-containing protein [Clostridium brassicae]|uniref:Ig-like domain-containing protein n=1 Tax=Clostridium brassicae TaxID=2999072 RepID=A0ABT4DB04_9CLOT|nr:Ig-like domain-containing protein [Clostridium brassicae]MCY6959363.1 Ig-like domain-containing protein [Clostridium brassicae]